MGLYVYAYVYVYVYVCGGLVSFVKIVSVNALQHNYAILSTNKKAINNEDNLYPHQSSMHTFPFTFWATCLHTKQ